MIDVVLDSSVILAHLFNEPGGDAVSARLKTAALSAVNLCEVAGKLADRGLTTREINAVVTDLGCAVIAVDRDLGLHAAALRTQTRALGLSLGDRVCLALALRESLPVLTADRAWATLDLPVVVTLIR